MPGGILGCKALAEPSIKTLLDATNEILEHKRNEKFFEGRMKRLKAAIKEENQGHLNYILFYKAFSDFVLLEDTDKGSFEDYVSREAFKPTYMSEFEGIFTDTIFDKRHTDIKRYARGVKLDEYKTSVLEEMVPHKTFEEAHPDVIFAGYPGLDAEYRCYKDGKVGDRPWHKNPTRWMQVLEYDLHIAQNQCSWRGMGLLSREILSTIGGKHGPIPDYKRHSNDGTPCFNGLECIPNSGENNGAYESSRWPNRSYCRISQNYRQPNRFAFGYQARGLDKDYRP
jgi:hypothetical protein